MKKKELSKKFKIIMTIITVIYTICFSFLIYIGISGAINQNISKEGLWITLIITILMLITYTLIFISHNKKRYLTIAMIIEIIELLILCILWIMWPLIKTGTNTNNHPCETCNIMKYDHE